MKKKDIDKYMYLDYNRGFNKALDEVEKIAKEKLNPDSSYWFIKDIEKLREK